MTLIQQKSRISFSEPKHQLAILVIDVDVVVFS